MNAQDGADEGATTVVETDLDLGGGRTLRMYDTGPGPAGDASLVVVWHHGTPNVGAPPAPLFPAARWLGIRWVSYDRPGYGGSTPRPDRSVGSAAEDVTRVVDALGVGRFAVLGHSGGGPHALACGALLADRVLGVVSVSGLAPFDAAGLDWFAGMGESGVASLRAAVAGRAEKERHLAASGDDEPDFTPEDWAALAGEWSWFGDVVGPAVASGPGPHVDDDLAYVRPWGFDPARITAPLLLVHGGRDRVVPAGHSRWLARHCRTAELRLSPADGHISVMRSAASALSWLHATAGARPHS